MRSRIKDIVIVSLSTLGSRILGLLRDVLTFAFFGTSALNSAFLFAFTIPNLFRRLLGEGALTSALVPLFSSELENSSKSNAFKFLNQVLSWALLFLLASLLLAWATMGIVYSNDGLELRWYWGVRFGVVLMPYMMFVCLAAILGAVLNVFGKFGVTSLSQVWLNLIMIGSLLLGWLYIEDSQTQLYLLCASVLLGGLIQAILPAGSLVRLGWRFHWNFQLTDSIRELLRIFFPGVAAAAVFQVNLLISRLLAFALNDEAVSVLYLANRLIEFPLGVFAVAVTTVIFPAVSRCVAKCDFDEFSRSYSKGLRMVLLITIPAAIGIMVLQEPILKVLFQWGKFDRTAVEVTGPILLLYAFALPFYSISGYATRGFHAFKDMKNPLYIAIIVFGLNLVLSVILMQPFGMMGLALANITSAVAQALLLHCKLSSRKNSVKLDKLLPSLLKMITASLVMAAAVLLVQGVIPTTILTEKAFNLSVVVLGISVGCVVYFISLWLMRFREFLELRPQR